ncbi:hypothetical protein [Salmonella enterica]|nr:hypothetical protein [Salmonella enterica]CUR95288.1 Uncharacterised protein [Salmonella enterica subsp. enterica serovar Weltevreden]
MNTNENWWDNREQQESDKSGTTSQELAYRLCWLGVWLVETRR